jgi:hypothetical protein
MSGDDRRGSTASTISTSSYSESRRASVADASAESRRGSAASFFSIRTPGVRNIEAAYNRAGATAHYTPGHASQLGAQHQHDHERGIGSNHFADRYQDQHLQQVRCESVVGQFVCCLRKEESHMGCCDTFFLD